MSDAEQREEAVFEAALQLPDDERAAYLDKTCADDVDLRRRVEVLLGAFERAGGFLKDPAIPTPARTVAVSLPPTEKPGDKIGRYKLFEQIGEGGCGVVYVAEQEEPVRRRVALKIIKLGMDTKQVMARFDAERQALAMMDHPNIAKVFDAGSTERPLTPSLSPVGGEGRGEGDAGHPRPSDGRGAGGEGRLSPGRPYFVMELVRGIKITDYCDQNHLSPRERLDSFIQVCRAIQHAHQKGVIHRDIKPSNILVTSNDGVPVPKVIDFGIAKATQGRLTDQTVYTAFEQFIGTPAYMSPEQAQLSMQDIDTRSDIYSLGVLLYELLTGKTPFDAKELLSKGLDEMRRTIREVEPIKPSTRLTQELNSKSEIRNPKSEMDSALRTPHSAFPSDLDWIVMKCLEKDRTRRYETANGLGTDIARHLNNEPIAARPPSQLYRFQKSVQRNKLAFGAATAVALAFVIGLAVSTVMFSKAQAEKKKAQTEAAKSQQVAQFLKDMLDGVGPSVALGRDTKMLREILDKTAESISKDLKNQPEIEIELRLTLAPIYHELGLFKPMEQMAQGTVTLARSAFGEENVALADALVQLGDAKLHLGRGSEAETDLRRAVALERRFRGDQGLQLADALFHLSRALAPAGKVAESESSCREALAIRRALLGEEHPVVARSIEELGLFLQHRGRLAEAENSMREALAMRRKLFGNEHPELARSYRFLGVLLANEGKLNEAEAVLQVAVTMSRKMAGDENGLVTRAMEPLADVLRKQGKLAEAESLYRELVRIRTKLGEGDVRGAKSNLADVLRQEGKEAEAQALLEGQTGPVPGKKTESR